MTAGRVAGRSRSVFPKVYADFVQKLRVPCGFLLLITFAWLSNPSRDSLLIGLPVCVAGLALRGWAAGHLAKDRELAMTGPYAYMRNPLYGGTLIVALGIVIASESLSLAAIFTIVFLFVYLPAIELEEQHLREIFPAYASYRSSVGRFLPIRKWRNGSARFSWARYSKNQEYKAALGFICAVAWLTWKYWQNTSVG